MRKAVLIMASAAGVAALVASSPPVSAVAGQTTKPTPTEAKPFGSISPAVRKAMLAQAPLSASATRLRVAADRAGASGYAGVGLQGRGVVLWWKGALPRSVATAVTRERRSVSVRVVKAAHSRSELRTAAKRIATGIRADPTSPYFGVEIAANGNGLTVDVDSSAPAVRRATALRATALRQWRVPAGIPVAFAQRPKARTSSRLNDSPRYWGGGRIQNNDNSAFCTAGFAVRNAAGSFMLTAGHCGRPGGGWNNGVDSRFFGTGSSENADHDLLLISASVAGRIWDGPVGTGEFTKGVVGSTDAVPNERLCSSGSTSGAVCNFLVGNSFQFLYCDTDPYGNRECYSDLVLARQLDGAPGSRPGDSGGPVFGLSGPNNVIAKGIISGVSGTTLIFQDFVTAQRDFGISAVTG